MARNLEIELRLLSPESRIMSRHGERIFTDAKDLVRNLLSACETSGHFVLRPREHRKMKGAGRIRVKYAVGQSIRMTVKPGDNGTAFEYDLVPPVGTNADELSKRMIQYLSGSIAAGTEGRDEDEEESETQEPKEEQSVAEENKPDPVIVPPKPQKTLLQRVSELETHRQRIGERKERLAAIDVKRAALQSQLRMLDDESMQILKEDEEDHEAHESNEILQNLERLFARG